MKYKSKEHFLDDVALEWSRVWRMIEALPPAKIGKRKRLGGDLAWSVKDAMAHVYAWHVMMLEWHKTGLNGQQPPMPAKGYNWRMTQELNREIYINHKDFDWASIKRRVKLSHGRVMKIVSETDEKEFMEAGQYNWTGKLSLCNFVSANTASHYRWAQKTIRALKLHS